jgi:glycosyltransferase involved in cell wall biosynthesis
MGAMLRVAIVTETFPPEINGVAMTFDIIARELVRRGHSVVVYRPNRRGLPPLSPLSAARMARYGEVRLPGAPMPGYPMMRLGLPAGGRLQRHWRETRPDLVHVVTEGPLGASAVGAARALGIPVTSSFHTNFHRYARHYGATWLGRVAVAWLRRVHNRTARTFVPTRELCDELEALGFRSLTVMSRGVDTRMFAPARRSDELRASWGVLPGSPVVIYAGRLAAEKNLPLLKEAYDAMKAANPRCRFVVVGDGPLRERFRSELPRALFTGVLQRAELARHYASADIFVHASLTETFGNVLTEAMASGLAVTGFDYAAARLFVRDGKNGLLAPPGDPGALVWAAVSLACDPVLRAKLGAAARAGVIEHSWDRVIGRFENDLLDIVRDARQTGRGAGSESANTGRRADIVI